MDIRSERDIREFGERVQSARKDQGLSQGELAQRANISRVYLSQIERGQATNISWQILARLSNLLGVEFLSSSYKLSIPDSLQKFAELNCIPQKDIEMLHRLEFRGKQPTTPSGWKILYNVIKATIESIGNESEE